MTSNSYVFNLGNTPIANTYGLNGVTSSGEPYGYDSPYPSYGGVQWGGAPFVGGTIARAIKIADITDGTSSTLMASEVIQDWDSVRGLTWWGTHWAGFEAWTGPNSSTPDFVDGGGICWVDGNPPNAPAVVASATAYEAARSRHTGGVNVARCDGSITFITNSIDLNTWRALSTAWGSEVVGDY
jgi:prepilin-type processing-associated H-X9-DG protein